MATFKQWENLTQVTMAECRTEGFFCFVFWPTVFTAKRKCHSSIHYHTTLPLPPVHGKLLLTAMLIVVVDELGKRFW